MISKWKSEFLENMAMVFDRDGAAKKEDKVDVEKLYVQIGQLKVENDFLKKKLQQTGDMKQRAQMVETGNTKISIRRQCTLLGISRSNLYYNPVGEKQENLKMMEIMDQHLIDHPTEGVMSMVYYLRD